VPIVSERLFALGLSADPFTPETPLDSLYPGAMRRASLDQLQVLARDSDDIIALTGPVGSGKSTLADFFARHADRDQIVARVRASLMTSPAQLLEDLFKAFVLDFPAQSSMAELKQALQAYFAAVQRQSRAIVLLVDDAHELGDEAFSFLVRLALEDNADNTFHLIVIGEPALVDMLDYTCPLHEGQSQFTVVQLPALSVDETRHYLRYRLNCVGFSSEDPARPLPFSHRQVDKIHKLSGGVPGAMHPLAQDMLGAGGRALSWLKFIDPSAVPRPYVYAAAGLFAVLLLALLLGGDDDESVPSAQRTISLPVPVVQPEPVLPVTQPATTEPEPEVLASTDAAPQSDSPGLDLLEEETTDSVELTATPEPESVAVVTPPADPEPVSAVVAPQASSPAPAPAPAAPTPAPVATTPAAPVAGDSLAAQHGRIQALPSEQFTVQLLGSSSRPNVEDFVRRHASSPLYWFETRYQGNPWYVVMHGAYPSRAAAQAAAAALSGELGSLAPWIRSIGSIKGELFTAN
jgi:DamX protein